MSYDLRVYGTGSLATPELLDLLEASGLALAGSEPGPTVTVVRGARAKYCFTLDLGTALEREDVPDEVVSMVLDPGYVFGISVEGSAASEIPHAIRFARQLATAVTGVLEDPQTDQYWSRGKLRQAEPVAAGLVDVVELRWYAPPAAAETGGEAWLTAARRWLPEALPRRFGTYEPFQGRRDRDGDEAFLNLTRGTDTVFFAGTAPCVSGNMGGPAFDERDVVSFSMTVLADVLAQPSWLAAVRGFFVDFAERVGAFSATAEVAQGMEWSRASLWHGAEAEFTAFLCPRGKWMGLPPYPVSWVWVGPDYADVLPPHLDPTMANLWLCQRWMAP